MPHIHDLMDFTVEAFVVYKSRVLLIYHKQLKKWLPLGGYIELDENPEQALFRDNRGEWAGGRDLEPEAGPAVRGEEILAHV
jgi:hypothetical protein